MSARARTRAPRSHSTLARVDQHAGVQDARRVERRLGGGECGGEARRTLPVVPGPVVAADGVVVRDRAAEPQDGVGGGLLDGRPLLELGAAPPASGGTRPPCAAASATARAIHASSSWSADSKATSRTASSPEPAPAVAASPGSRRRQLAG